MSHGIEKPIDIVFSIQSPEWHGLADVVPVLDDETVSPILFPILEGSMQVNLEGTVISLPHHKALVADLRGRAGLCGTENEFVPLHTPKNSYHVITNGAIWEAMKTALAEVDATISTAGTLEAAKKFFISCTLGGKQDEIADPYGNKVLCNMTFLSAHDGTLALTVFDSTVRVVCMNTFRASLSAAGDVGFKVYHTAGADLAISSVASLVNAILSGRATFRDSMEYLAQIKCSSTEAKQIALGFLIETGQAGEDIKEVSKRTLNAAEEIATLFARGAGNKGENLFDLSQGATDYWTNGSGTGKKASLAEKVYKGKFGQAADRKNAFFNLLMSPDAVARAKRIGERAESLIK